MKKHARLESILIHSDFDRDDLPLSEYLQNGERIEWAEVFVHSWAVLVIVGCIIARLLN